MNRKQEKMFQVRNIVLYWSYFLFFCLICIKGADYLKELQQGKAVIADE